VGPNTVATLLSYRGAVRSQEGSGRGDFLYELAYTIVFLGAIVLLFVFKGYMESFGRAIEAPAALFSDNGLAAKLGLAYVIGSFFFAAYLITRQDPEDRSALMNFFVPIYLLVSGAALVFSGYLALGHMR
jgi:hypothetical protein